MSAFLSQGEGKVRRPLQAVEEIVIDSDQDEDNEGDKADDSSTIKSE